MLETIKRRIKMGTRDMYEQKDQEMWFILVGINPLDNSVLHQKLLKTLFADISQRAKGVVLKISQADNCSEEVLRRVHQTLAEVPGGEIKVL